MANMTNSMLRNLQHFVEFDLAGVVKWHDCRVVIPVEGDGNVVEVELDVGGRRYNVRIESSDYGNKNQLGRVLLDDKAMGPIDEKTWDAVAMEIKAHVA